MSDFRKILTFRVNDVTPDDHIGRRGEITYRDGYLYYHNGSTAGGEIIGGGGAGGPTSWSSITSKPTFATVATSGSYADLIGTPTIPADISDLTDNNSLLGSGGSANTGDIVFNGDTLSNPEDQVVRLESQNFTQTASYSFTPGNEYSTAVWSGTEVVFNDPTQAVYDAIWALTDISEVELQINGTWYTVTYSGSSTPGLPAAATLFVGETAVDGPLNIDVAEFRIRQGTTSYVEIDGSDFRVDVQDDIRMYANDTFRLVNRSSENSISIQTNDGQHSWYFRADGNLELPYGSNIVDSNGNNVIPTVPTSMSQLTNDSGFIAPVSAPASSLGAPGDEPGKIAFDAGYIYYCTAFYDGVANIWKRVAWSLDTW